MISEKFLYFFTVEFSHFWWTNFFFSIVFFGRLQQRPCESQKFLPTDSNKIYLLQKCFFAKSLVNRDVFSLLNRTFCTKNKRAMRIQKIKKIFIFQSYLVHNASFVVKCRVKQFPVAFLSSKIRVSF